MCQEQCDWMHSIGDSPSVWNLCVFTTSWCKRSECSRFWILQAISGKLWFFDGIQILKVSCTEGIVEYSNKHEQWFYIRSISKNLLQLLKIEGLVLRENSVHLKWSIMTLLVTNHQLPQSTCMRKCKEAWFVLVMNWLHHRINSSSLLIKFTTCFLQVLLDKRRTCNENSSRWWLANEVLQ